MRADSRAVGDSIFQTRTERFTLGGLGPLAFGDLSPKAKPPTGLHFAQCPAGGLKRPQMPSTGAALLEAIV